MELFDSFSATSYRLPATPNHGMDTACRRAMTRTTGLQEEGLNKKRTSQMLGSWRAAGYGPAAEQTVAQITPDFYHFDQDHNLWVACCCELNTWRMDFTTTELVKPLATALCADDISPPSRQLYECSRFQMHAPQVRMLASGSLLSLWLIRL